MGYDLSRFEGNVDDELKCPICCCVLEEAVQAPECEHTFCSECINEWLTRQTTCPVDRQQLISSDLKPAPRVLRNFLAKLDIKCEYASFGCSTVTKLELLNSHCNECDFNPYKPVICEKGCGLILLRNQVDEHNCLSDLRELVHSQKKQIKELKTSKRIHDEQIAELRNNKRIQDETLVDHERQIHTLQDHLTKLQHNYEQLQKLQGENNTDDDEDVKDLCTYSPKSLALSRKRPPSWKDVTTISKRSLSSSQSERSCLSEELQSHQHYHHLHAHCSNAFASSCVSSQNSETKRLVITFYGSIITCNVLVNDLVESVKAKIHISDDIPIEHQLLFFAGQQLEDQKSLSYYNIHKETSRHLVLRLRDGMKIFVKTLSDKTIEVQVDPSDTIEIVKVKIHEQEGISPCDQRLLLDGRDLADLRTLSDYGIKHNTTLQLDLHLGGPCPICQSQFRSNSTGETPSHSRDIVD